MSLEKDILWFRNAISKFENYNVEIRSFTEGDFGSLDQIEFNSTKKGGNVDFWGQGWLGIFLWDYQKEEEIINVLIKSTEYEEKDKAIDKLLGLL